MWAASSWGRYWGWDPKEVWSLVAFLGYMAIMHLRVNRDAIPAWAYGVALLLGGGTFWLVVPQLAPVGDKVGLWFAGVAVAAVFFLLASGRAAVAVKSILAFWLIIMTYIGVNFVLGVGMHSY
jgi:ABC-type transport system involved in cytochrome c biogenesis permease subunit